MALQLRQARPEDAPAIAQIKNVIWPEEATPPDYIAKVIEQPDHRTLINIYKGQIVGFVDGFLTLGASGQRRWEVDLLGVYPTCWGQGFGTKLVQAVTQAGQEMKAEIARGLVAITNVSSQKAFAKAGYVVEERPLNLWVSSMVNPPLLIPDYQLQLTNYFLPVITLNYHGAWLEGDLSAANMQAAQVKCAHMGLTVTGTLIDVEQNELNEAAQALGYYFINQFQWWWCRL